MKSIIISLKYHPGHYSHIVAFNSLFKDIGFSCSLIINKDFKKLDPNISTFSVNDFFTRSDVNLNFTLFLFPTLRNIIEIFKVKIFTKSKIIYVFHEPIDSYYEFYKAGFSFFQILRLFFINIINIFTISFSNYIILPSNKAFSTFEKKYKIWNKNFTLIPLLFDDENIHASINTCSKKFISYIGTIASDHAFSKFCDFIIYSLDNRLFEDFIFLIASGSALPPEIKSILDKYHTSNRLVIVEGSWLSNEDINKFFNQSLVVWNAYDRSTQSGVLPKSFMFSTPVLGNAQIPNEYIIDNYNGIYLEDNSDVSEISNSIKIIIDNIDNYCKNSRDTFLTKFYYKNYISAFTNILNNE